MGNTKEIAVSLQAESSIAWIRLDGTTGALETMEKFQVPGGPAPLALMADKRVLYAGLRDKPGIAALRVSGNGFEQFDSIVLESDPCYVGMDKTRSYLFCTYYRAGMVTIHRVEENGTLQTEPAQLIRTHENAHSIWIDSSNNFAFVPHTGPNKILQFVFDSESGLLSPNNPRAADVPTGVEPRHMAISPDGNYYYCSNEKGSSVTTYRMVLPAGILEAVSTVSTLPAKFGGENSCAQIQITPNGRSLYVSNRGHDTIACFSIDPSIGLPVPNGHAATEQTPRAIRVTDDGTFLLAAGLDTGNVEVFAVDPSSGSLESTAKIAVGKSPMWIEDIGI